MAAAASSAACSATPMQTEKGSLPGLLPWVEKYRPVTLDDVSLLGLAEDERKEEGTGEGGFFLQHESAWPSPCSC